MESQIEKRRWEFQFSIESNEIKCFFDWLIKLITSNDYLYGMLSTKFQCRSFALFIGWMFVRRNTLLAWYAFPETCASFSPQMSFKSNGNFYFNFRFSDFFKKINSNDYNLMKESMILCLSAEDWFLFDTMTLNKLK